jgi:hypothetical protein
LTAAGNPIVAAGVITLGGVLNIASGGTGQTSPAAAFDALMPLTNEGDMLVCAVQAGVAHGIRLGVGFTGQILMTVGGLPTWEDPSALNYIPNPASNWDPPPPTTIHEALDRLAAACAALGHKP